MNLTVNIKCKVCGRFESTSIEEFRLHGINTVDCKLLWSLSSSDRQVIMYLGDNVEIVCTSEGLRVAALKGRLDVIQYLNKGFPYSDIWDDDIMAIAAERNQLDVVKVKSLTLNQSTAVLYKDAATSLVKKGILIHGKDYRFPSPLYHKIYINARRPYIYKRLDLPLACCLSVCIWCC
ncbi:hypothetical protein DFA_04076 [Cavenderia fasciculata]|uniref:Uncharacterized protein n=1 Tax=Cavenderia fasciculata TaxID=261658 RepID=F4Q181_CACFS|nr:uncharacterized protein DFA_04076 [Cavenderia fasciculata]EGG18582.1 hypothetical protein DFA_04076 [Cavenderia fasciculata]|eukprot:XP_004366486.1 hypothetical protein DFA_04076 [Cavenderia fasciculata]